MVLITSDSCNTLVSLEQDSKQHGWEHAKSSGYVEEAYTRTELWLPADDFNINDSQPIYLPTSGRCDEYLKHVPEVVETCDEFLANEPVVFDRQSFERILYVGQGEVAHALPLQCDVLVTDKATTCHMLALRSESDYHVPLTSLTHIDDITYENCVKTMVMEHLAHHQTRFEDEKKEVSDLPDDRVKMQLHIVGGFEDAESTSSKISNWILRLFAKLAEDFKAFVKITLQTCAISGLNDNGYRCPIARGLAIDLRSGHVFLAKVDQVVTGPATELRAVRVWCERKSLNLIHTSTSMGITLNSFFYIPIPEMKQLLCLPDECLLQLTSTSPDVEEEGFCEAVRSTVRFFLEVPCSKVFGPSLEKSLIFQRVGASNMWNRTH